MMEAAFFFIENRQADDFNSIPDASKRRGNLFWSFLGSVLNLPPERFPYDNEGVSPAIATLRKWESLRTSPAPTISDIVADVVDEVREAAAKVVRVTKTQRAVEWLGQVLRDGPVPQKQIEEMAVKDNIGTKPLKLAKARLKVQSTRKGRAAWAWVLPFAKAKDGQEQ